jgi:hypothetical protein
MIILSKKADINTGVKVSITGQVTKMSAIKISDQVYGHLRQSPHPKSAPKARCRSWNESYLHIKQQQYGDDDDNGCEGGADPYNSFFIYFFFLPALQVGRFLSCHIYQPLQSEL